MQKGNDIEYILFKYNVIDDIIIELIKVNPSHL